MSLAPCRLATKTVFTFVFFLIVLQTINIVLVYRWQYILYIFLFSFSGKEQRNTKLQQPGKKNLHEDLSWTSSLQALQVTFKTMKMRPRSSVSLCVHFAFSKKFTLGFQLSARYCFLSDQRPGTSELNLLLSLCVSGHVSSLQTACVHLKGVVLQTQGKPHERLLPRIHLIMSTE